MTGPPRPVEILLVEDDPDDAFIVCRALRRWPLPNHVVVQEDGERALAYLHAAGTPAGGPLPDLVLLDLNLPRVSGLEVLASVKADPRLRRLPVVVLTSSVDRADVAGAYERHANTYVRKPVGTAALAEMLDALASFWFRTVRLPGAVGAAP